MVFRKWPTEKGVVSAVPPRGPTAYEGSAVPGQSFGRAARITSSKSLSSTGFWKKAVAPASSVFCSSGCASRAAKTITGILDKVSLSRSRCKTAYPSPAGRPRSRMIRFGCSFCATEMRNSHRTPALYGSGLPGDVFSVLVSGLGHHRQSVSSIVPFEILQPG